MRNIEMIVKVPGKLFIAGEYAVLESGQRSMVVAVDRFMTGKIKPNHENELSLPQIGFPSVTFKEASDGTIVFSMDHPKLSFIKNVIILVNRFLKEKGIQVRPFSLTIVSELDDDSGKKYGLGSSAAIVVTAITAILSFLMDKSEVTKELVYKLSSIVHYKTQGNGSCADIAASVYGGWLQYSTFRGEWLTNEIINGKPILDLIDKDWPELLIQPVIPPDKLSLAVGWTGYEAKTGSLVKQVQELKKGNMSLYKKFLENSQRAVIKLAESFAEKNVNKAVRSLAENRLALKELGEITGVPIETPGLHKLIEIANQYGAGKSSGAGGGDCGIAFLQNEADMPKLQKNWEKAGVVPLNIKVSKEGARVIR